MPSFESRRPAKCLYVLNIDTFSKEAKMVLSRILGDDMNFLFSLRFLKNKASRISAAGHFNVFFVNGCSFLDFHRHIISTLQRSKVRDYLFLSCLLWRFIKLDYSSMQLIRIGGGINDFNE